MIIMVIFSKDNLTPKNVVILDCVRQVRHGVTLEGLWNTEGPSVEFRFRSFPPITTMAENLKFCKFVKGLLDEQVSCFFVLWVQFD